MAEAGKIDKDWNRDSAFEELAEAQARAGDFAGAASSALQIKNSDKRNRAEDSIGTCQTIIEGDSVFWKWAYRLLGRRRRTGDPSVVAMVLAKDGRWQEAERIAMKITAPDLRGRALYAVAVARAKSGDFVGALSLANSTRLADVQPNALIRIAEIQLDRGQTEAARKTLDQALAVPEAYQFQHVLILTQVARDRHRMGDTQGALDILASGVSWIKTYPYPQQGSYYTAEIINAYARLGRMDRALALADRLPSRDRSWAYLRISHTAADMGHPNAEEIAGRVDPKQRDSAVRGLAFISAKRGQVGNALRLVATLSSPISRDFARQYIAEEQAKSGDIEGARSTLSMIPTDIVRAGPIKAICRRLAKTEGAEAAMREAASGRNAFERACGYAGTTEGLLDRHRTPDYLRSWLDE